MTTLLDEVIEAEKAAAANVIMRREDANPVLMRLKELETMKDIAEKIDEIKLVMGTDGLKQLMPFATAPRSTGELPQDRRPAQRCAGRLSFRSTIFRVRPGR